MVTEKVISYQGREVVTAGPGHSGWELKQAPLKALSKRADLFHTHTHTHTFSLSHTHTHTHILSLSLSHTHTHTHTYTFSLSLSLSLSHTHTHTFSLSVSQRECLSALALSRSPLRVHRPLPHRRWGSILLPVLLRDAKPRN